MGKNARKLDTAMGVLIGAALSRTDIRQVISIYPTVDILDEEGSDSHGYTIVLEMIDPSAEDASLDIGESEVADFNRDDLDEWIDKRLAEALGTDSEDDDEDDDL